MAINLLESNIFCIIALTAAPARARAVCRYDTIGFMRSMTAAAMLSVLWIPAAQAQSAAPEDPIVVSSEHPRLFLRPARLRLLRRERERTSLRWEQFQTLMAGNAAMPEPGFAFALYYQVAGDKEAGRKAIDWTRSADADLRQMSLVFDWCYDLMTAAEREALATRLVKKMSDAESDVSVAGTRSRTLAAVTLFDEVPGAPQRELERIVRREWEGTIIPAIKAGDNPIHRDDAYALYEMLHAVQDNVKMDLRESVGAFFKDFPIEHLLSYYPAPYQSPENDYFIGAERMPPREPDLKLAALSRAAELAMVAYDANAPDTQVLQGWLMHDKYLMRGAFGTPYEFLWANPYQPGLSYYHVPLVFYAPERGRLFIRLSWDDDAQWLGIFDGAMQIFSDGQVKTVNTAKPPATIDLGEAIVCFGNSAWKQQFSLKEAETVFVTGLQPKRTYSIEIDDEETYEATADRAGVLALDDIPWGRTAGVRITAQPLRPSQ